jgi:hypothetical protein
MSTATATGFAPRSAPSLRPAPPPFPTPAALALERASWKDLEKAFVDGGTPDLDDLAGWEFRGINRMPLNDVPFAQLVGIKKFCKGFFRGPKTEAAGPAPAGGSDGRLMGYNSPVARNALDGRWHIAPKKFGFYEVCPVDATARDNVYLHAVLLDYGKGGNKAYDPMAGLRDYVVQLADNLFLGKAYYALGPTRLGGLNFFILERHRVGLTDYVRR